MQIEYDQPGIGPLSVDPISGFARHSESERCPDVQRSAEGPGRGCARFARLSPVVECFSETGITEG
jgi:hypothetical protein